MSLFQHFPTDAFTQTIPSPLQITNRRAVRQGDRRIRKRDPCASARVTGVRGFVIITLTRVNDLMPSAKTIIGILLFVAARIPMRATPAGRPARVRSRSVNTESGTYRPVFLWERSCVNHDLKH